MIIKTRDQIALMAEAGKKLKFVLTQLKAAVKPGITTLELDKMAEQLIKEQGATVSFKGYQGYPFTLCASVNAEVVHTFPNKRPLQDGDIVSLDLGLIWKTWQSDSAITVAVGTIDAETQKLVRVTEEALMLGIKQMVPGNTIGDIGAAIQAHGEKAGLGVVRDLTGHGIGQQLHEPPAVPNFGKPHKGLKLQAGMVLAIEPMFTLGDYRVDIDDVNWTVKTRDGSLAAHFEHTIAITEKGPQILTA